MYIVIIGDIIASKKLSNRAEVQDHLEKVLKQINNEYQDFIASKFIITIGDEFQGVLMEGAKLLEIIDKIRFMMDEINLRFGIGIGDIYTKINYELSIGADGPAYWKAREAINYIHEHNDFKRTNLRIEADQIECNLINELLGLCGYIESTWQNSQQDLIKKIILKYGYDLKIKQVEIAKDFELSTQNVYLRLKKMGYHNYVRSRIQICSFLSQWEE